MDINKFEIQQLVLILKSDPRSATGTYLFYFMHRKDDCRMHFLWDYNFSTKHLISNLLVSNDFSQVVHSHIQNYEILDKPSFILKIAVLNNSFIHNDESLLERRKHQTNQIVLQDFANRQKFQRRLRPEATRRIIE